MAGRAGRWQRLGCAALAVVALLVGAVAGVAWWLGSSDRSSASSTCTASADGTDWRLSVTQADNAALIAGTSGARGLPARAATIALATALQESKLVNIDYGDRDSVGLFQQRPSQGWGTVEEILDPVYSTGRFYDGLVDVPGYTELPVTEAAQAVQRSAFPEAYAQHEPRARAWASALRGWSSAALTCDLRPTDAPGSVAALTERSRRDFAGTVTVAADATATEDGGVRVLLDGAALTSRTGGDAARTGWALGQWAVAVAADQQVVAVEVGGERWERDGGGWQAGAAAVPAPTGTAAVTLAG